MSFKAICTDIDGTLLNKERQLSIRTISTIRALHPDIPVILASSRMPSAMRHLQRELGIEHHPLIAYNGGYVLRYSGNTPEVYCSVVIPGNIVAEILSMSAGTSVHNSLYREDAWYAPADDQWTEREERITKVKSIVTDVHGVAARWQKEGAGAHKVMCMGEEADIQALETRLKAELGEQIHIYRSRATYLELAPKSISKATGLKTVLQTLYDLPMKNVISFGDNYNDIELLQQSGLGIAVANAREEVHAVAAASTGKSVDDGVAMAIEKYFFQGKNV